MRFWFNGHDSVTRRQIDFIQNIGRGLPMIQNIKLFSEVFGNLKTTLKTACSYRQFVRITWFMCVNNRESICVTNGRSFFAEKSRVIILNLDLNRFLRLFRFDG